MWVPTHNSSVPRVSETTKSEHRERLLQAAAAEFAAKGLAGARIDDISLSAGLAKGTIYNYFDSKVDVFQAVVEEWVRRTVEAREAVPGDASIRDQLLAVVHADAQVVAELEEFARTAMREVITGGSEVAASVSAVWEPVDSEILRIVRLGQEQGEVRNDREAEQLVVVFNTLLNGLLLEHWIPGSGIKLSDIPELAVDYYLDGVRTR